MIENQRGYLKIIDFLYYGKDFLYLIEDQISFGQKKINLTFNGIVLI